MTSDAIDHIRQQNSVQGDYLVTLGHVLEFAPVEKISLCLSMAMEITVPYQV